MLRSQKSPFADISQVGVVVRDIDRTIEYLSTLGIGPFQPSSRAPVIENELRGKPAKFEIKLKFAQLGPLELELIQPVTGHCIQREFLESKGEGVHHLGVFVDDLDKEVDRLTKQGVTVLQRGRRSTGGGYAYLDTAEVGGIVFELLQV